MEHAFANASGSRENAVWPKTHRDVSIVCGDPAALVHQAANLYDLFAMLLFGL